MRKAWMPEEVEFLEKNYTIMGGKECAKQLNRSWISVVKKARYINLLKHPNYNLINKENAYCTRCLKEKSRNEFDIHIGHTNGLSTHCKECRSKYSKKYWQDHKEECQQYNKNKYWKDPERYRGYSRNKKKRIKEGNEETRKKATVHSIILAAKYRAKDKNMEYELNDEWALNQIKNTNGFCPVLRIKYTYCEGNGYSIGTSPSIDRINNKLGYTIDNSIIVSRKANSIKSDATVKELYKIYSFYRNLQDFKESLDYEI